MMLSALCLQDLGISLGSGQLYSSRLTSLGRAEERFECLKKRWTGV